MGETEVSSRSLRRSDRLVENQVKDSAKVVHAEDERDEAVAERRASKGGQSVRRSGKQCEEEVVTGELMGIDVVNAVSLELGSLKLNDDCNGNSRSSGTVLNAVPQEFVANMERSLARGDNAAYACSSSDEGDEDDTVMDLEGAGEQEETSTALSREDAALLVELTQVIQRGGDWKELTVRYLKAYLRQHGLRKSGVKSVLVDRVEQHLKIKDGQGEDIYPRSSFTINCKGDVCLGDTVLFSETVYNARVSFPFWYDTVKRSAGGPPLGERWVAGKVVHESYGAETQQDTFIMEVLWSTGTKPYYIMRPLRMNDRNLYRMDTLRQPWIDEEIRERLLKEKHDRRKNRQDRRISGRHGRAIRRSKPRSRSPSETQHLANSSRRMPRQSSIQQDFQQNIFSGSSVAASSRLPHLLPNSVQQGREALVQQQQQRGGDVSHSSLLSNTFQGQGICHIACSNRNCKKAGAKHCVWQSCAVCCYKNGSSRGSCPRHQ